MPAGSPHPIRYYPIPEDIEYDLDGCIPFGSGNTWPKTKDLVAHMVAINGRIPCMICGKRAKTGYCAWARTEFEGVVWNSEDAQSFLSLKYVAWTDKRVAGEYGEEEQVIGRYEIANNEREIDYCRYFRTYGQPFCTVNDCCIDSFVKECSDLGYGLIHESYAETRPYRSNLGWS